MLPFHTHPCDNYCRPCRAAYKQEHYKRNRQRYIDNARRRDQRVLQERTLFMVQYLKEHPCVDCGERDVVVLDFDHIGEKKFALSSELKSRPWTSVLAEMKKCEVVCANCHRRRTARRAGWRKVRMADPESG